MSRVFDAGSVWETWEGCSQRASEDDSEAESVQEEKQRRLSQPLGSQYSLTVNYSVLRVLVGVVPFVMWN